MSSKQWYHKRDEYGYVCCVPGCRTPLPDHHPLPVCGECGWMIASDYREVIILRHRQEQARREAAREAAKPREERWEGWHVVYYLRIADYIKIGTTKRLKQRVGQLRASSEDLLAIEEGDQLLEARRHRQFAADRINTRLENFRPSADLLAHIESLGGRASLPDWARHPDTRAIQIRANVSEGRVQ